jgi:hypothetical protein
MTSQISVSTSSDTIVYRVKCIDDSYHKVIYDSDGNLTDYAHDLEAEEVTQFLGGEPTACARARFLHDSVLEHIDYLSGSREPSNIISLGNDQWKSKAASCTQCSHRKTLNHLTSLNHLLAVKGVEYGSRQAKAVCKRLLEVHEVNTSQVTTLNGIVEHLGFELETRRSRGVAAWLNPVIKSKFITLAFLDVVKPHIAHNKQIDYLFFLRESFTTDWLVAFFSQLSDKAQQNLIRDPELMRKISKARNKEPHLVAEYVNQGIYSHIYTYIQEHVSPRDARIIFEHYPDARSAKELLGRNESVSGAVHRLSAS